MSAVDRTAKATAAGAERTQSASDKLVEVAEQLQSLVGHYKRDAKRFDSAPIKAAHNKWKVRLADLLAGRQTLDPQEVSSHRHCEFGKWYFGDGTNELGALPSFKAIDEWHAKVHTTAREIAVLCQDGHRLDAGDRFVEFRVITDKLFALLDALEREANA